MSIRVKQIVVSCRKEDIERVAIASLDERMEQYILEARENREFIATQVDGIELEARRIVKHLMWARSCMQNYFTLVISPVQSINILSLG
jgi:hypothetical protein